MQQLAKSIGSLTWAVSLLGLQQIAGAARIRRRNDPGSELNTEALDSLTRASLDQCTAAQRELFAVGDTFQRTVVDALFRPFSFASGSVSKGWGCGCSESANSPLQPAPSTGVYDQEFGWGPVPPEF